MLPTIGRPHTLENLLIPQIVKRLFLTGTGASTAFIACDAACEISLGATAERSYGASTDVELEVEVAIVIVLSFVWWVWWNIWPPPHSLRVTIRERSRGAGGGASLPLMFHL